MKKLILTGALFCATLSIKAQWTYKKVNNGIDDPYKIAYSATDNNARLKLENSSGKLLFYISGLYFCDEFPEVDIVYVVNGENKKYKTIGAKSEDSKIVFLAFDLLGEEIGADFKKATSIKVRVNESHCTTEIYSFLMKNGASAVDFLLEP